MFDDVLRKLRELERGVSISINMPLDEAGCLDRRCPAEECGAAFKIPYEDWQEKVSDEHAFCPFCRHEKDPQEWNTPEQQEYTGQVGLRHVSGILDTAFASSARRFNQQQKSRPRGGLIDLSMSMQYKPGAPIIAVAPVSAEALRQQFVCETCACRWSSLGGSYFRPACGYNSVEQSFNTTLATVRGFLDSTPALRSTLTDSIGKDDADTTIRQLVEDQFARVVGAFVQQRHILEHKQGIIDRKYIYKSGDAHFQPGQRLVIRPESVRRLVDIADSLARGLQAHLRDQGG